MWRGNPDNYKSTHVVQVWPGGGVDAYFGPIVEQTHVHVHDADLFLYGGKMYRRINDWPSAVIGTTP